MKIDSEKIEQTLTRGVEQVVDKEHLEKALTSGKKLRIKLGIDPTGDKIHIGRATQLWKLKSFQDMGHQIVLIIGDFTALIGDPSDKPEGRKGLKEDEIKKNVKLYSAQIGKILDLKKTEIRHNSEWFNKMALGDFLHLAGSFSVQQLAQRRNFNERWKKGEPISLKEVCYPLLQGYDSVAVKADLELGGYDQLFNLNAGRDIQRLFGIPPQDIMTLKMLSGLDGRKMSTSWGNVINIIDKPEDMYGKLMSMRDEMILDYFELCVLISNQELGEIKKELKNKKVNPKDIKARLAREIVSMYHGEKSTIKAEQEFHKIFREKSLPSRMPVFFTPKPSYPIMELLYHLGFASSNSEGKRLVLQGGVRVDSKVIKDFKQEIKVRDEMVIQVGKRKFAKLITHDGRCE
jgi:tyrosyl-tRNA synthetase